MSVPKYILFGILVVIIGAIVFAQFRARDRSAVQAKIKYHVQAFDDALYLNGDYEGAKKAANDIVNLAASSDDPACTEARGLARLAFLEIATAKWGNQWKQKIKRCEKLVSPESTIARAEFLLYTGIIRGKFQGKFEVGIKQIEQAIHIAGGIRDDRTLALAYTNLGELYNFLGHRNLVVGNSYRAVAIAKHYGQNSVLKRTLRNLINELADLGKFSEAAQCGRELLEIAPGAPHGMFTLFLTGKSEQYLDFVEDWVAEVNQKKTENTATPRDFAGVGKALKKLATACLFQKRYSDCRKYVKLAKPYLKIAGDDQSLKGCREMLIVTKLDLADTVGEVDRIATELEDNPSEISLKEVAAAYANVGEFEKSSIWKDRASESKDNRSLSELGFLKQSSDLFWESEVNSRQVENSDRQATESQSRVWLLTAALVTGLVFSILLGSFYVLLRRERNSLEDIVEARTRSLSKAVEAASAADRAKSDFLAQINHEIRNPLTAILGYCDLLTLSKERTLEIISGIESSSLHLRELVDKILEVSKIESNGLEMNCIDFRPAQTTNDINDILLERVAKKDLRFACSFIGDPNCLIFSDETKIRQIAINLISNSIKFTESGSVTVSFALNKDDANLTIVVKDTGIGIAEAETRAVFDQFAKATNGVDCDGSGLGLFITKQLVECLGGSITLTSELGFGTHVTVCLPVKFSCDSSATLASANGQTAFESETDEAKIGKRVIIVDDQEIIRTSLELLFKANGIECETAQDLQQTIDLIKSRQPDMVLLDLRMPKQSGYEMFETIRQTVSPDVPIYAMTGDATAKVKEKCLSLGFDGFIIKPFKIKTIQDIIEARLKPAEP